MTKIMTRTATILFGLLMMFAPALTVQAQVTTPPLTDEQQKEKAALEKKALVLLDQVIAEAPTLKLPENRIRLQINIADLLWQRNEARARTLFSQAGEGVAEMIRSTDANSVNQRRSGGQTRRPTQLREELVLTVARHDAPLAYQLLASTRSLTPPADNAMGQTFNSDQNLEQILLSQVALLDPKLALQNAEQLLEKGQYPRTLASVLYQLQQKDKEAATKLEEKLVQRLQSANMLASIEAGNLAISLLAGGPRPASTATTSSTDTVVPASTNSGQLLAESSYQDLMRTLVDAALRATPAPAGQRGANGGRGRGPNNRQDNVQTTLSDGEIEQNNARRLLNGVQSLLPKIDQYLPDRAQAVRLKAGEIVVGAGNDRGVDMNQVMTAMQKGDANSLETLAAATPPPMQNRIYQQAAMRALDEGDITRAQAIADDHLEPNTRAVVAQAIDFRKMANKIENMSIDEVRTTLAGLSSDNQRTDLLLQLAAAAQKKNTKLARQLLDEAQRLVSRPATSYQQMDAQIKVARGFTALDTARSFQVLEPGILQLNELLSAAAVLNGFEVNIFSEGELPMQPSSGLGNMVSRYAQEISLLAKTDFERAQTLANRFQLPEPRIQARLAIAQRVLRPEPTQTADNTFGFGFGNFGGNFRDVRQPRQ
jgi:hypothetical protein